MGSVAAEEEESWVQVAVQLGGGVQCEETAQQEQAVEAGHLSISANVRTQILCNF